MPSGLRERPTRFVDHFEARPVYTERDERAIATRRQPALVPGKETIMIGRAHLKPCERHIGAHVTETRPEIRRRTRHRRRVLITRALKARIVNILHLTRRIEMIRIDLR